MEKISVIIPVYKVEKFLRQCVDSVLAQTYTNLEVILVDDGSPDNCGAICDEYAQKDNRVKVIHKENGGVSSARNAGIDTATGGWIMFVDGDDVINCQLAEFLKCAQNDTEADIIYSGALRFDGNVPDVFALARYEDYEIAVYDREQAMTNAFGIAYTPTVWAEIIRKSLFEELHFPDAKRVEDLWISYQLLNRCKKIAHVKNYTPYYYRITPGSAMSKITARHIEDDMKMRLDVFLTLFANQYQITEQKLAKQTKRIFMDFALCVRSSRDKACKHALKKWSKLLYKQMWKPTAKCFSEKMDYALLFTNVGVWTWWQLMKYKLFKVPLYIE